MVVPVPTKLPTMGEAQIGHLSVRAMYRVEAVLWDSSVWTSETIRRKITSTSVGVTPSKELGKCVCVCARACAVVHFFNMGS